MADLIKRQQDDSYLIQFGVDCHPIEAGVAADGDCHA